MLSLNKNVVRAELNNSATKNTKAAKNNGIYFSKPRCTADITPRDFDTVWNISEKHESRFSDIWSRMKKDNVPAMRKLPEIFYRGVTLHFSDGKTLFIFKNVAILKDGALIEIKKDRSRSLEKKILYSAPDMLIPDVVFDIEFCIDPPRYKKGFKRQRF